MSIWLVLAARMCVCAHMYACVRMYACCTCCTMSLLLSVHGTRVLTVRMLLCQCFSCFVLVFYYFTHLYYVCVVFVSILCVSLSVCVQHTKNFYIDIWESVGVRFRMYFSIYQSASYNHLVLSVKHLHTIEREFVSLLCV